MSDGLPLEVIGWLGPVLTWVEGGEELRVPESWRDYYIKLPEKEKAWLVREFPTRTLDTIDEIVSYTRPMQGNPRKHFPPLAFREANRWSMRSVNYRVADALAKLSERYFEWSGDRLSVRRGMLEELHELSLRFPVEHLIRYRYIQTCKDSLLSKQKALGLPVHLGFLATSSRSLQTIADKGLTEGHMHLNGVIGASEAWADHLLPHLSTRNLSTTGVRSLRPEEKRIRVLGRNVARILALGLLCYRFRHSISPPSLGHLVDLLDSLYRANDRAGELSDSFALARAVRRASNDVLDRLRPIVRSHQIPAENGAAPPKAAQRSDMGQSHWYEDLEWLLRWVSPSIWRMHRFRRSQGCGRVRESLQEKIVSVGRLLFETQENLFEPGAANQQDTRKGRRSRNSPSAHQISKREEDLKLLLDRAFFRYLVYQTHHWQRITQSGTTTGLRQFKRFESSGLRQCSTRKDRLEAQLLVFQRLRSDSIRALEGRVSPPERADGGDLIPWILACRECNPGLVRFGLVLHFIKSEIERLRKDDAHRYPRVRHSSVRRNTEEGALRLFRLLSSPNPIVPFIAGIDAANVELTTPPEVFAPAFRFLREFPVEILPRLPHFDRHRTVRSVRSLMKGRRLGMTYHVGEDFRHILSGLRAIDEAIQFLDASPGDRLGHATALSHDPCLWAEQNGYQALMPQQEWLDTLVWLHNLLGPGHDLIGELEVEDRIQRLAWNIYDQPYAALLAAQVEDLEGKKRRAKTPARNFGESYWSPLILFDAWRLRQLDPRYLEFRRPYSCCPRIRPRIPAGQQYSRWALVQNQVLRQVEEKIGSNAAYLLAWLYWFDKEVRKEGNRITKVEMKGTEEEWMQICRETQQKMKRRVKQKQLIIEANPSSNRIIGPMTRISQHQIFNLTLDQEHRLTHEIRTTVNSDDPGIFNTSIEHEYYMLGEAFMRKGASEGQTSRWLNWLRKNGRDYCFDLPDLRDPRIQTILRDLHRANRSVQRHRTAQQRLRALFLRFRRADRRPPKGWQEKRIERLEAEIEKLKRGPIEDPG